MVDVYLIFHPPSDRLCGFEPFFDDRGDQYMFKRILNCEYEFVSPWWDNVSLNAKDLVSSMYWYQGSRGYHSSAAGLTFPSGT